MLAGRPSVPGKPVADRGEWNKLDKLYGGSKLIKKAEPLISRALPEQPDELYLEFSRNGNRTHWQNVAFERRGRLTTLVLAECLESKGRFVPAIEDLVTTLCAERTWVLPAHDRKLTFFRGEQTGNDLASSALGWNLATADYLVGSKLAPAVRARLRDSVEARVLAPFRNMIRGRQQPDHWLTVTNNWNAVCLAGVVGAALALLDSDTDKAEFVAAAEEYSKYFLAGFTSDGYCSEGLGYWNYGFGNFVVLSEMIRFATGDGIELLARPEARIPALFATRIEIANGVSPAFADCSTQARPSSVLMWLIDRRLGALSGGELQRVLLALALNPTPDLLILDEPVSGVDHNGQALFLDTVNALRKQQHMAILLVSHDWTLVQEYADQVVLIDKTVKAIGTADEVFSSAAFMASFPHSHGSGRTA